MLITAKQACKLFRASPQFKNCISTWSGEHYKNHPSYQRAGFWAECAMEYMEGRPHFISEEEKLKFDRALRKRLHGQKEEMKR